MEKSWKERLESEMEVLQQGRDELRVQMNLAAADARDAWGKVEKKWDHLEARIKQVGQATQDSAEEVEEAAKLLVDEIKEGYKNVRNLL